MDKEQPRPGRPEPAKQPERRPRGSYSRAATLTRTPARSGEDVTEVTGWYKKHAEKVNQIKCDKCGRIIAIEAKMPNVIDGRHPEGMTVVPLNDLLLSYRRRADMTMGFSCECGNNTILLPEEAELRGAMSVAPHVEARIKDRIAQNRARGQRRDDKQFERVRVK
jgi:hypothetical protein